MSKTFEDVKLNMKNAEAVVNIYNNPAVKAVKSLLDKIPVIGALIDETTGYALQRFQDKKREEFIDIILSSGENITSDKVNDVEFLINFAKTVEAVDRLSTNDKVKYFANLLKNGYFEEDRINSDDYEAYFETIKRMSLSDIKLLSEIIKKNEVDAEIYQHYYENDFNKLVSIGFLYIYTKVSTHVEEKPIRGEYDDDHTVTTNTENIYKITDTAKEFAALVLEKTNE